MSAGRLAACVALMAVARRNARSLVCRRSAGVHRTGRNTLNARKHKRQCEPDDQFGSLQHQPTHEHNTLFIRFPQHGENRLAEWRPHNVFDARHGRDDPAVEKCDLRRRLRLKLTDMGVHPPAEKSRQIHVMQFADMKSRRFRKRSHVPHTVTAVMTKIAVDGAEERWKCGHDGHNRPARNKHGCHAAERREVVFNVLQHVQAHARIRMKARERFEIGPVRGACEGEQIRSAGVPLFQKLDAFRFGIGGHHHFAIQKHAREVADSATDLHYAPANFASDQTALPREIVARARHSLLVID